MTEQEKKREFFKAILEVVKEYQNIISPQTLCESLLMQGFSTTLVFAPNELVAMRDILHTLDTAIEFYQNRQKEKQ